MNTLTQSTCAFCNRPAVVYKEANRIPGKSFPRVPLCRKCNDRDHDRTRPKQPSAPPSGER